MKRAFTLLELLLVVGLMSMLGVAAAAGYGALNSGMKDRGTCDAASAVFRAARERADVDRRPTIVFCYNRCIKEPTDDGEAGVVVGMMTAVRQCGRITWKSGNLLYDEFNLDVDAKESVSDEAFLKGERGHRLFKYDGSSSDMKYSIIADEFFRDENGVDLTMFSGVNGGSVTNLPMNAFYDLGRSDRQASWKIGDGYGFEFLEIQLPKGYVFGTSIPRTKGQVALVEKANFKPGDNSSKSVEIYLTRPDAQGYASTGKGRKAGEATTNEKQH